MVQAEKGRRIKGKLQAISVKIVWKILITVVKKTSRKKCHKKDFSQMGLQSIDFYNSIGTLLTMCSFQLNF